MIPAAPTPVISIISKSSGPGTIRVSTARTSGSLTLRTTLRLCKTHPTVLRGWKVRVDPLFDYPTVCASSTPFVRVVPEPMRVAGTRAPSGTGE